MKRIDSVNARPDENGLGKAGFNDNADLPGQDATYITPDWFNTVQEELCNLLELRGISLNPESKRQLYDLLSTQTDLEALATEIENNFIRKNQIIDNLTTNDATKPVSAKQAKKLQDEKFDKSALNNTLTSTSTTQAVTAAQAKFLNDQAFGVGVDYYDVTSLRVKGTIYTATGSKPRQLFIDVESSGSSNTDIFFVRKNDLSPWMPVAQRGTGSRTIFPIILPGYQYKYESPTNFTKWVEVY